MHVCYCRGAVILDTNITLLVAADKFRYVFWALQHDEFDPNLIVCGVGHTLATVNKLTGEFITIAGDVNGGLGYVEGVGSVARFNSVTGVTQTRAHYLVSDSNNNCIRSVRRNNHETTTFAGRCKSNGTNDGPLLTARLMLPRGLTKYSDEIFYLCDHISVRIIDLSTGYLRTYLYQTQSNRLYNTVIQPSGDVFISANHGVLQSAAYGAQWITGGPTEGVGCDSCSLSTASFYEPWGISFLTPTVLLMTDVRYRGLRVLNISSKTAYSTSLPVLRFPTCLLVDHHTNTIYIGEWETEGGGLRKLPFSGEE